MENGHCRTGHPIQSNHNPSIKLDELKKGQCKKVCLLRVVGMSETFCLLTRAVINIFFGDVTRIV